MNSITSTLRHRFPSYGERNVTTFYWVSALGNAWFQIGNWLLFVLLFMGEREFAVYEAIAFGAGLLLEIPSGAIADLLGKRKTVIAGQFLLAAGAIIFILGYLSKTYLFLGNLIIISAFALISGALEALVYDTLVQSRKEEHYDDIIGKARSLEVMTLVIVSIIGAAAWQFSVYAPWMLTAAAFVVAFFVSFRFIEPKIDTEVFSWKSFLRQNRRGFHYLFKSDFRKYTFSFAALLGTFLMWSAGIIRVLMGTEFGYDGTTINLLIAGTMIASFVLSYNFSRIRRKFGDLVGFGGLLAAAAAAWIVAGVFTSSIILGALVFFAITISGTLSEVWTSVILNAHVKSKDRATAISTLSFLVQIPYVFVVILFGDLFVDGNESLFYLATGAIMLLAFVSFVRAERAHVLVKK